METYQNFDPEYIKLIEEITFNQISMISKNNKRM